LKNILSIRPEEDWKRFGELDPYFGVLSNVKYKSESIDDAAKEQFFESGVAQVNRVFEVLKAHHDFTPGGRALDFGCGVGRITSALSPHFETVTGLDIAPGMLAEARRNALARGDQNLIYGLSDDASLLRDETYDFVHSYIVLQHIPVRLGEQAIRTLLKVLRVGGYGAIHFTYGEVDANLATMAANVAKRTPLVRNLANVVIGRRWGYPTMQMNAYSIARVVDLLAAAGVHTFTATRVDDWTHYGLFIFFRKLGPEAAPPWSNPKRRSNPSR